MKRLILLLLLMMVPGLGETAEFSTKAATVHTLPVYGYGDQHQVNAREEDNRSNHRRILPAGPTNEVEAQRLRLIFLLMMSLGQYRTPVH